ncbi:MAG: hypothetical protein IJ758_01010 [Clostridia bacterium]|nr:hypothetical protein [Clostridia bacterium]
MKRATNLTKLKIFARQNKILVILASILLLGIFFGAIIGDIIKNQTVEDITSLFLNNYKNRENQPIFYAFISSLSSIFLFILATFLIGLSAWGFTLAPFMPFFRGLSIGLIQNYLYSQYGMKGILFQILVLLPGIFISSIAILLMAKEAMIISYSFSNRLIFKERSRFDREVDIKTYIIKVGYVLSIALLSVIVDSFLNFLLLRFFHFA